MNFKNVVSLSALPILALACAAPNDSAASASSALSDTWFAANAPAGSPQEQHVLALVNDSTMTAAKFVSECGFTGVQAASIVSHREGDDLTSKDDNEAFDDLAELDALPFTDEQFWTKALHCASTHVPGPPVCGAGPRLSIELVVDQSGSMEGEKWAAERDALLGLLADLKNEHDQRLDIGVLLFSDGPDASVAPRALVGDQYDRLLGAIDKDHPKGGGTGTLKALQAAYAQVDGLPAAAQPGARKVVVLLTDGVPVGGVTEQQASIALAADEFAAPRPTITFAVGIGAFPTTSTGSYDPAFVGNVAVAGGTAPAGCDPQATSLSNVCHYQVTPSGNLTATKQSLVNALKAIRSAVMPSCP